jgi:enamine deaminase RidA (YjgF/YER057c/UK114 family)
VIVNGGRLLYLAGQVAGELRASTLIVVKSLFHPDFLIEVDGVAAI